MVWVCRMLVGGQQRGDSSLMWKKEKRPVPRRQVSGYKPRQKGLWKPQKATKKTAKK